MAVIPNLWLATLNSGENLCHAYIFAAGYLWAGCLASPAVMVRIDPVTPTNRTTITFPNDASHNFGLVDAVYDPISARIYTTFSVAGRIVVDRLNPADLSHGDVISDTNYDQGNSIATDGTYLYIASASGPASRVIKYRISDFTDQGNVSMGAGNFQGHCVRYDTVTGKLYATSVTPANGGWIARIDPTTMTLEEINTTNVGVNSWTDDMGMTDSFLWLGSETTGRIFKVQKSSLSVQTSIDTGNTAACYAVASYAGYIWAVYNTSPGILTRLNPSDLSNVSYSFGSGQNSPNEIVYDSGTFYYAYFLSPAKVSATVGTFFADTSGKGHIKIGHPGRWGSIMVGGGLGDGDIDV